MKEFPDLKIYILENPYDLMENKTVRDLFSEMARLKIKGYRHEYDYGVMPLDTSDFIANHLLICIDGQGGIKPVSAYRSLPLQRAAAFGLEFPALALAKQRGTPALVKEVQDMMESSMQSGRELSYDSSWTADPGFRGDRRFNRVMLELLMGLSVWYHRDYHIPDWITTGILRLETHETFFRMGLVSFENDPVIRHPSVHDEEAIFVKLKEFSETALRMAQKHQALWDERVEFRKEIE